MVNKTLFKMAKTFLYCKFFIFDVGSTTLFPYLNRVEERIKNSNKFLPKGLS